MCDDAEEAHEVGIKALKGLYDFGLHPREKGNPDGLGDLQVEVRWIYRTSSIEIQVLTRRVKIFGCTLANPIGIKCWH